MRNRTDQELLQLLGLSQGASLEQVKTAYRDQIYVWHPDRFVGNERLRKQAEERTQEINLAYSELKRRWENLRRNGSEPNVKSEISKEQSAGPQVINTPQTPIQASEVPLSVRLNRIVLKGIVVGTILWAVANGAVSLYDSQRLETYKSAATQGAEVKKLLTEPNQIPIEPHKVLSSLEIVRLKEILGNTIQDDAYLTPEVHKEFWMIVKKTGLNDPSQLLGDTKQMAEILQKYQRAFWEDALMTLKFQRSYKSESRARLENSLQALIPNRIKENNILIEKFHRHEPVRVSGQDVVFDEAKITQALNRIDDASERLKQLLNPNHFLKR